jgi:hypothetical protein
MIAEEAIRFAAHEARKCRNKDAHEALCLLFPAMLRLLGLKEMDDFEALGFTIDFREELRNQINPEPVNATQPSDERPIAHEKQTTFEPATAG